MGADVGYVTGLARYVHGIHVGGGGGSGFIRAQRVRRVQGMLPPASRPCTRITHGCHGGRIAMTPMAHALNPIQQPIRSFAVRHPTNRAPAAPLPRPPCPQLILAALFSSPWYAASTPGDATLHRRCSWLHSRRSWSESVSGHEYESLFHKRTWMNSNNRSAEVTSSTRELSCRSIYIIHSEFSCQSLESCFRLISTIRLFRAISARSGLRGQSSGNRH